jgi:hypothetical protein
MTVPWACAVRDVIASRPTTQARCPDPACATISVAGAILANVIPTTLDAEPACPPEPAAERSAEPFDGVVARPSMRPLTAIHRAFESIDRASGTVRRA